MGYAQHIGRVGALAVTLGIGSGLVAMPWSASAAPTDSAVESHTDPGSIDASRTDAEPDPDPTSTADGEPTQDADAHEQPDRSSPAGSETDLADVDILDTAADDPPDRPDRTSRRGGAHRATEPATDAAPSLRRALAPEPGSAPKSETTSSSTKPFADAVTPDFKVVATAPATFVATQPTAAVEEGAPALKVGKAGLTVPLAPLLAPGPGGTPTQSPAEWALLAWARKQFELDVDAGLPAEVGVAVGTLAPINAAPVSTPATGAPSTATGAISGTLAATDSDGDVLTYAVSSGPSKGTVVVNADGTFTYTPTVAARLNAAATETDAFTIAVSDGQNTPVPVTLTLPVTRSASAPPTDPVTAFFVALARQFQTTFFNESPIATPVQFSQSSAGVVYGSVGAVDPDGDPLTFAIAQGPSRGTVVVNTDGTYSYTPNPGTVGTPGTDSFTVTVTEANAADHVHGFAGLLANFLRAVSGGTINLPDGSSIQAVVSVTIGAVGSAPAVGSPAFNITGTESVYGVVAGTVNVTDPDQQALTYALTSVPDPSVGNVVLNPATGSFTFTPTAAARLQAFNTAATETATFTVTASDGTTTTTGITVAAPIDATAVAPVLQGLEGNLLLMRVGEDGEGYLTTLTSTPDGSAFYSVNTGGFTPVSSTQNTPAVVLPGDVTGLFTPSMTVGAGVAYSVVNYLTGSSSTGVLLVLTPTGTSSIPLPGRAGSEVVIAPDGTAYLALSQQDPDTGRDTTAVVVIRNGVASITAPVLGEPSQTVLAPDGSVYVISHSYDYDAATIDFTTVQIVGPSGVLATTSELPGTPSGIVFGGDGTAHLTMSLYNSATNSSIRSVVAISPTGGVTPEAYIGNRHAIGTVAGSNGFVYQSISENDPVTNRPSNVVVVIDPSGSIITSTRLGNYPSEIYVAPDGTGYQNLFDIFADTNTVRIITPTGITTSAPITSYYQGVTTLGPDGRFFVTTGSETSTTVTIYTPTSTTSYTYDQPGNTLTAGDGVGYLALFTPDPVTGEVATTTLVTLTSGGTSTLTAPGYPVYDVVLDEATGTVYLTTMTNVGVGQETVTVTVISVNGTTTHTLSGTAVGNVLVSSNGTAYQVVDHLDPLTGAYTSTLVTFAPNGNASSHTLPGRGGVFSGDDGGSYLLTYTVDPVTYAQTNNVSLIGLPIGYSVL